MFALEIQELLLSTFYSSLCLDTGPINNVQIVRKQLGFGPCIVANPQGSSRRHGSLLPPPLEKYTNSSDDDSDFRTVVSLHGASYEPLESPHISSNAMDQQIEELKV